MRCSTIHCEEKTQHGILNVVYILKIREKNSCYGFHASFKVRPSSFTNPTDPSLSFTISSSQGASHIPVFHRLFSLRLSYFHHLIFECTIPLLRVIFFSQGTRRRGRLLKTWREGIKDIVGRRVTDGIVYDRVNWKRRTRKANPIDGMLAYDKWWWLFLLLSKPKLLFVLILELEKISICAVLGVFPPWSDL